MSTTVATRMPERQQTYYKQVHISANRAQTIHNLMVANGEAKSKSLEKAIAVNKEAFTLGDSSFSDIRMYTISAQRLPAKDVAQFQSTFSQTDLNTYFQAPGKPEELKNAYNTMQNVFMSVYRNGYNYHFGTMPISSQIFTVTLGARDWAQKAETDVSQLISNLERLKVGVHEKPMMSSAEIFNLTNQSCEILSKLGRSTLEQLRITRNLTDDLERFQENTERDSLRVTNVSNLICNSESGIISDIAQAGREIEQLKNETDTLLSDYYYYRDVAISVSTTNFWNIAGWIVLGVYTDRAVRAKNSYDEKMRNLASQNTRRGSLLKAASALKSLDDLTDDIVAKIPAAITAVNAMKVATSEMQTSYTILNETLDAGAYAISIKMYEEYIEEMRESVPHWSNIKRLAQLFYYSGGITITAK